MICTMQVSHKEYCWHVLMFDVQEAREHDKCILEYFLRPSLITMSCLVPVNCLTALMIVGILIKEG